MIRRVGRPGVGQKEFNPVGFNLYTFDFKKGRFHICRNDVFGGTSDIVRVNYDNVVPGDITVILSGIYAQIALANYSSSADAHLALDINLNGSDSFSSNEVHLESDITESDNCDNPNLSELSYSYWVGQNVSELAEISIIFRDEENATVDTICTQTFEGNGKLLINRDVISSVPDDRNQITSVKEY